MGTLSAPRLLVADDQADVLKALRLLFKSEGLHADMVSSPAGALEALAKREYDVVLMDLNYTRDTTSGREGLNLLSRIRTLPDAPSVVVMTAWASVQLAVEAMRLGAQDFIEKPWANDRLLSIVKTQFELRRAVAARRTLEAELQSLHKEIQLDLIATSRAMEPVLRIIERVGDSDANVLITGENGTGKGLIARVLHARSSRAAAPLITVDVGGLSETLFESELFGHVKGAFTDARADRVGRVKLADGGTLFLDEIGNIPGKFQAKLLRVVESGEYEPVGSSRIQHADARIIAATNADLGAEVAAGRFRQDLLFRLNTLEIHLPPLRDRREDIPLFADHFLRQHSQRYGRSIAGLSSEAVQLLLEYSWPGNVRQLAHVMERAVLMAQQETIAPGDLGLSLAGHQVARLEDMTLEEVERVLIEKALTRSEHNISRAAVALGLSRTALYRRLEKHGLAKPGSDDSAE